MQWSIFRWQDVWAWYQFPISRRLFLCLSVVWWATWLELYFSFSLLWDHSDLQHRYKITLTSVLGPLDQYAWMKGQLQTVVIHRRKCQQQPASQITQVKGHLLWGLSHLTPLTIAVSPLSEEDTGLREPAGCISTVDSCVTHHMMMQAKIVSKTEETNQCHP